MSFLLQESRNQNNNQSGGRTRLSVRNSWNDTASTKSIVDDNARIFPGKGTASFKRGNRKLSLQQISGNQIMLQRQKRRIRINKQQEHQHQQERQHKQNQEQPIEMEQSNLGDYTMERVMQDLHILEQQQREAKRKLASAETIKHKRLEQQRQLNTLLENKNYSNGALRAKLRQSRDFLSVTTRELGNRKLATDRLQDGIADFEYKLKRGLQSAKMIQICIAKIDFFLIMIEHRVADINRLRMKTVQVSTEIRQKYEQSEKKDRMLRLAIQDTHKRSRKRNEEKLYLRIQISELDNDKRVAQNTEQSTELRIQSTDDQIKIEADRVASLQRTLSSGIEEATKQHETVSSEVKAACTSLKNLEVEVQGHQEKIVEYKKVQGHVDAPNLEDVSPVFDQRIFRENLARLEEEMKKDENDLCILKKSFEEVEVVVKISQEKTLQYDKDTSILIASSKSLVEEEEKREKDTVDFQVSLDYTNAELIKLEKSFIEMEATRESEARAKIKAISDCDIETRHQIKEIENLKLKIKTEDLSLRTNIRLFDDTEKILLQKEIEETKDMSLSAENKYQDLVDVSNEVSIESKLHVEFEQKIVAEQLKWDTGIKHLVSRCNEHLKNFPRLLKIYYAFDKDKDKDKQVKMALVDLERECAARKATAEAVKEQKILARKKLRAEIEAMRSKLKAKEETQAQIKRRQVREESNRRVKDATFTDVFVRQQRRRRKGSDFFDPRREDNNEIDGDLTPNNPRKLTSLFLSQGSGQRVRWKDGDIGDNNGSNDVDDGVKNEYMGSHFKDKDISDSFYTINKSKPLSKGKVETDSSSTKTLRTTNTKEPKHCIDAVEMEKKQPGTYFNTLDGRRRNCDDEIARNQNMIGDIPTARHLEKIDMKISHEHEQGGNRQLNSFPFPMKFHFDDKSTSETRNKAAYNDSYKKDRNRSSACRSTNRSFDDSSSGNRKINNSEVDCMGLQAKRLKEFDHMISKRSSVSGAVSLKNTGESNVKTSKINSKRLLESRSTRVLGGRKKSSRRIRKDDLNDNPVSTKYSNATSKSYKSRSGSTHIKSREKNRRKSNQEDVCKSSPDKNNSGQSSRRAIHDKKKERPQSSEGWMSGVVPENKNTILDKVFLEEKSGEKKLRNNTSSTTKEKDYKRREKINGRAGDVPLIRSKVHRAKSSSSISRNKSTNKGARKERRYPSIKDVRDNEKGIRSKSDKQVIVERDSSNGKDREKSCSGSIQKCSTERVIRKEISHEPLKEKTLSSLQQNKTRKKRKIKEDIISVPSSKTTVTARRRKKRNTGLSQRPTNMNVRDESCNFNF